MTTTQWAKGALALTAIVLASATLYLLLNARDAVRALFTRGV